MTETPFVIEKPSFDPATRRAVFSYRLGSLAFMEKLQFPTEPDLINPPSATFARLLDLAAAVLGVSYFKLRAPLDIDLTALALTTDDIEFLRDVYENGLGEFYARNDLRRFGKLRIRRGTNTPKLCTVSLPEATLLPIGGGKDSLVSVQLLERAGIAYTPFAVNPKGPIFSSVEEIGHAPLYVQRTLDAEMIRLGSAPGYYNGHVPSTAINSMIAALAALLFGYNEIILSNERSADEGNMVFDGRETNHQYSKSLPFEQHIAETLAAATDGALGYFSLLRPYSEVRIAGLFARETRFDKVFSSCNRNFLLSGHDGGLWCGNCPKCHFTFLILAPNMAQERLLNIFGSNLLARGTNEKAYRELTGLAGQKPWECVGEILEAAACLWHISEKPEWRDQAIVKALRADLENQYGGDTLDKAFKALYIDADDHLIPTTLASKVAQYAV